jgi:hypothetical protein
VAYVAIQKASGAEGRTMPSCAFELAESDFFPAADQ